MSKSQVFVCYSGSYFVARHNADLNLSVTESECVIRLAAFMRNTGIPWAFTYGNHDTESLASANKQELNEVYKLDCQPKFRQKLFSREGSFKLNWRKIAERSMNAKIVEPMNVISEL